MTKISRKRFLELARLGAAVATGMAISGCLPKSDAPEAKPGVFDLYTSTRPLSRSEEKRRYDPTKPLITTVGGLELRLCGVHWDDVSFDKYKGFYDELISNAICVVDEFSPNRSDYGIFKMPPVIYNWKFNQGIWDICRKYKKEIFRVDPINLTMWAIDEAVGCLGEGYVLLSPMSIYVLLMCAAMGDVEVGNMRLGRRELLKLAGAVSAGFLPSAYLCLGTFPAAELIVPLENDTNRFIRGLAYGGEDFRNVIISRGLEIVPEMLENDEGDYILAFHGWTHTRPIDYYLTHRTVRQIKDILYYPTYRKISDCSVSKYDIIDGSWREIGRRPI